MTGPGTRLQSARGNESFMSNHEFKDVAGKVIESVAFLKNADGVSLLDLRFQDKTGFHIRLDVRLALEAAELRDWKDGEGTLVKKFL